MIFKPSFGWVEVEVEEDGSKIFSMSWLSYSVQGQKYVALVTWVECTCVVKMLVLKMPNHLSLGPPS